MGAEFTKSPKKIALAALEHGRKVLQPYSHRSSPQLYSQAQHFAILILKQFFKTDLRGIVVLLSEHAELREVLGLKRVPHYSTLCYAEKRLLKKTSSIPFSLPS